MFWILLVGLAHAGPWDATFDVEGLRDGAPKVAVLYAGAGERSAAEALCDAVMERAWGCAPARISARAFKQPDAIVAAQRSAEADEVYVLRPAAGVRDAVQISLFDRSGKRLDWFLAEPGTPPVNVVMAKSIATRIRGLEQEVDRLSAKPPPDDEEEARAAALLRRARAAADDANYFIAKKRLAELEERYPGTRAAEAGERLTRELAVVGRAEPPLTIQRWYQGEDQFEPGEATLYVFWEAWCPHCARELPLLQERFTRYRDRGLQILALTKATRGISDEDVLAFVAEHKLEYPVAKELGATMSHELGVSGIPAAAIAVDGEIVWRGHPARLTDGVIDELLVR